MTILIIEILIFIFLILPTIYAFNIGAPIIVTPKSSLREALKYCKVKKGDTFYDLGSGTGRSLILAQKEFGMKALGFELSPILFLISKVNLFLNRQKIKIKIRNFYNSDLSKANLIFCFLTSKAMEKLVPKFEKELKKGTKIISYSFKLMNWNPIKIIHTDNPGKIYIYEKK